MFETPVKEVTLVTCTQNDKDIFLWPNLDSERSNEWSFDGPNKRVKFTVAETKPKHAGNYICRFEGKTHTSRATSNLVPGEV